MTSEDIKHQLIIINNASNTIMHVYKSIMANEMYQHSWSLLLLQDLETGTVLLFIDCSTKKSAPFI